MAHHQNNAHLTRNPGFGLRRVIRWLLVSRKLGRQRDKGLAKDTSKILRQWWIFVQPPLNHSLGKQEGLLAFTSQCKIPLNARANLISRVRT